MGGKDRWRRCYGFDRNYPCDRALYYVDFETSCYTTALAIIDFFLGVCHYLVDIIYGAHSNAYTYDSALMGLADCYGYFNTSTELQINFFKSLGKMITTKLS